MMLRVLRNVEVNPSSPVGITPAPWRWRPSRLRLTSGAGPVWRVQWGYWVAYFGRKGQGLVLDT